MLPVSPKAPTVGAGAKTCPEPGKLWKNQSFLRLIVVRNLAGVRGSI
ncbi:MAG: hypothetical protein ACI822_002533, partial [Gammaproteobacteria bacterium]